jgi:hypothetical protein
MVAWEARAAAAAGTIPIPIGIRMIAAMANRRKKAAITTSN